MKFRIACSWLSLLTVLAPQATSSAEAYDCLIEPAQVVELRSAVEGLIAQVHVKRGDRVRRGQVLVELQSKAERIAVESARYRAQMQGQIETARNRIDFARKKWARATELANEQLVSAQARDEAQAELRLAEAELIAALENRDLAGIEHQRAIEQLALRTMVSPFDGVVLDRLLNPGDLAESGSGRKPVLKLAQIDPLRVDMVLPGTLFGKVHVGTPAVIVPTGFGGRYAASVRHTDKVIDAASGTIVARVELANPEGSVPSGVRCRAELTVGGPAPETRAKRRVD